MKKVTKCHECGSNNLIWHCGQKKLNGVVDGRLRMHEVSTEFYLGCESCSETLQVVGGDQVAEWLTSSQQSTVEVCDLTPEQEIEYKNYLASKPTWQACVCCAKNEVDLNAGEDTCKSCLTNN